MLRSAGKQQEDLLHLVYLASDRNDIVNRFSPEGYEILSDEFTGYLQERLSTESETAPIVTEITGTRFSSEEQAIIRNAVWTHYCLALSTVRKSMRDVLIRILGFLICTMLSVLFLYAVKDEASEVLVQYGYLPFWFFGYRLLIYPLFDYLPLRKQKRFYRRLAAMRILFTESPAGEIPAEIRREVLTESSRAHAEADTATGRNRLANSYFMENGKVCMEGIVTSPADILSAHAPRGEEQFSDEWLNYLDQADEFIDGTQPLQLTIRGGGFSGEEAAAAKRAAGNTYSRRLAEAKSDLRGNILRIIAFSICLLIASLLLLTIGKTASLGGHEMLIVIFWFFGDYLVEYFLIENRNMRQLVKKNRAMAEMDIRITD